MWWGILTNQILDISAGLCGSLQVVSLGGLRGWSLWVVSVGLCRWSPWVSTGGLHGSLQVVSTGGLCRSPQTSAGSLGGSLCRWSLQVVSVGSLRGWSPWVISAGSLRGSPLVVSIGWSLWVSVGSLCRSLWVVSTGSLCG